MRLLLLAGANSIHTARWANGLVARNIEVHLVSAHRNTHQLDTRVHLYVLKNKAPIGYLTATVEVRMLIKRIRPELVNAHYASGYGLLARLAGFKSTLLSVWGSDVYNFPNKSPLHFWLLKENLKFATAIAVTSRCLERKTAEIFQHKKVFITPFGIDETHFLPAVVESEDFVLGTVKALKPEYGIDILIKAFAQVWQTLGSPGNLHLEIAGDGPDFKLLKKLAKDLGVLSQIKFHGHISHEEVPVFLNRLNVYCALSRMESFGVAILEASSCGKPVLVSDADGPTEVVLDGKTGLIVKKEDVSASANAMIKLVRDEELRQEMGRAGRQHVLENYTWSKSLDVMIDAYNQVLSNE